MSNAFGYSREKDDHMSHYINPKSRPQYLENNNNNQFKPHYQYDRQPMITQYGDDEESLANDFNNKKHMDSLDLFANDLQNITRQNQQLKHSKNRVLGDHGSNPFRSIQSTVDRNQLLNQDVLGTPLYQRNFAPASQLESVPYQARKQQSNIINNELYDELDRLQKSRGREDGNSRGGNRSMRQQQQQENQSSSYIPGFNAKFEVQPTVAQIENRKNVRSQSYQTTANKLDLREFHQDLVREPDSAAEFHKPRQRQFIPVYENPANRVLHDKIAEQNRLLMQIINSNANQSDSDRNFQDFGLQYSIDKKLQHLEQQYQIKNEIRTLQNQILLNNQKHELETSLLQMQLSNNNFMQFSNQAQPSNSFQQQQMPMYYPYPYRNDTSGQQDPQDEELDSLLQEFLQQKQNQKRPKNYPPQYPANPISERQQNQQQPMKQQKPQYPQDLPPESPRSGSPPQQQQKASQKYNPKMPIQTAQSNLNNNPNDQQQPYIPDDRPPQQQTKREYEKPWFPDPSPRDIKKSDNRVIRKFLRQIRVLGAANLLLRHYRQREQKRRVEDVGEFNENFQSKAISGLQWLLLSCRKIFSVLSQNPKQDLDIVSVKGASQQALDQKYSGIIMLSQFLLDSLYDYSTLPEKFPLKIQQFIITYFTQRSYIPNDFLTIFELKRIRISNEYYYINGVEKEGTQMLIGGLMFVRMLCAAILTKPWDFSSEKMTIPDTPIIKNQMKTICSIFYLTFVDIFTQRLPIIDESMNQNIPEQFRIQPLRETIALNFDPRAQTPSTPNTSESIVSGLYNQEDLKDFYQQKSQWLRDFQVQMDKILDNLFDIVLETQKQMYLEQKKKLVEIADEDLQCTISQNLRDSNYKFVELPGGPLQQI